MKAQILEIFRKDPEKVCQPLLIIETVNECLERAKNQPIPNQLFDAFFHEGEICILFADTNLGKSILAVQIADSISKGTPIAGFNLESPAQPIIYFDFELTPQQQEQGYDLADFFLPPSKSFNH